MMSAGHEHLDLAHLSNAARRLLRHPRPLLRGVLHQWSAVLAIPIGGALVAAADGAHEVVSALVFSAGMTIMLAVSGYVQGHDWGVEEVERLIRIDHSAIFLTVATSATPIALLGLSGRASIALLIVSWCGALAGIAFEWMPIHPPRGVVPAVYMGLGWSMLAFLPWMLDALSTGQLSLLLVGGAAYTLGAVVLGLQRPDPWPATFGYHEIWHIFVVVGVGLHLALTAALVTGSTA